MSRSNLPPVLLALVALGGCDQTSQSLPFEPDPTHLSTRWIGPQGGLISHAVGMSVEFPAGALDSLTQIYLFVGRDLDAFPGSPEGALIPGTFFRISPPELKLKKPVLVDVAVLADSLEGDELVRLAFATERADAAVLTEGVTFDLTSGILRGRVESLGAIAAIVSENAVAVLSEEPPELLGGTFAVAGAPQPSGVVGAGSGTSSTSFTILCGHSGPIPRCFQSGSVAVWASSDLISSQMVLLNVAVDGSLDFTDFEDGVPTRVFGALDVQGTLRVQLGQAVTSFEIDDSFVTNGPGGSSAISFDGPWITLHQTSAGTRTIGYELTTNGESEELTVRAEHSMEFAVDNDSTTTATLTVDLKLQG